MKDFSISSLLKNSWSWVFQNAKLWIFGLFITSGGILMQYNADDWNNFQLFGQGEGIKKLFSFTDPASWVFLSTIIIFILTILISIWARGSLVKGISEVKNSKMYTFWQLAKNGLKVFPRLLLLEVYINLVNLILIVPTLLYFRWPGSTLILILFVISLILFFIYNLLMFLFRHYCYCYAVLSDRTARDSFFLGYKLFVKNAKKLILVKVVEVGLIIVTGLAMAVSLVILAIPFLLIAFVTGMQFGEGAGYLVGIISAFILVLVFLVVKAIVNTFFQMYLTQVYWEVE